MSSGDPRQSLEATQEQAPSVRNDVDETVSPGTTLKNSAPTFGPSADPREIGVLGPYRVVKELGHGGMGAVYAAIDTRLNRKLALKVMLPQFAADPAAKERFLREARAAAQVSHDNVVTVYEADERDGVPYIAMQYLEGYPLDEYVRKKGNPTLPQVLRIARETASGLAAAHRIGLVHRDVKPGNLWLEAPNGRVKVLDFGLAKPLDAEIELTKSGAVVGTPAYMSPEQARGEKVDHRTDLFSLGVVMYRLCTGKLPFEAPNTMAVLMRLAIEDATPVRDLNPGVSESLAKLIHQLLAKKAEDRPPSAEEVANRLRSLAPSMAPTNVVAADSVPKSSSAPIKVTASPDGNPFADVSTTQPDQSDSALRGRKELLQGVPRLKKPAAVTPPPRKSKWKIALAAGFLLPMFALGIIFFWPTPDGVVRFEIDDPQVKVVIDKDGPTITGADAKPITLKPGKHGLTITRGDFTFDTKSFEINKGDKAVLKVEWLPGKVQVLHNGNVIDAKDRPTAAPAPELAEFRPLFNGNDLAEWKTHPDFPGDWRVENGVLVGSANKHSFLVSDHEFSDVHVRVEATVGAGTSAGVMVRGSMDRKNKVDGGPLGYIAKINVDSNSDPRKTGSLYVVEPEGFNRGNGLKESPVKADEWFTMDVIATGGHVIVKVNGQITTDFQDDKPTPTGRLALQFYNGPSTVRFRKIQVKEIKPAGDPDSKTSLDGVWNAQEVTQSGARLLKTQVEGRKLVISGNRYSLSIVGATIEGEFRHDPAPNPKTLEFIPQKGGSRDFANKPQLGVYTLDGDALTFCVGVPNGPRPTKFDATPHGWSVQVYRRAKVGAGDLVADPDRKSAAWVSLFNGNDLGGWKSHPGMPGDWKVVDGAIVGSGETKNGLLFTELGDYDDFHLRLKARINEGGNSGVFLRVPFQPNMANVSPKGYEVQIERSKDAFPTGSVWGAAKAKASPIKADEWFDLEVIAQGSRIATKVNGALAIDYADFENRSLRGHLAIQCLAKGAQRSATDIRVKSIEIKRLSGVKAASTSAADRKAAE